MNCDKDDEAAQPAAPPQPCASALSMVPPEATAGTASTAAASVATKPLFSQRPAMNHPSSSEDDPDDRAEATPIYSPGQSRLTGSGSQATRSRSSHPGPRGPLYL